MPATPDLHDLAGAALAMLHKSDPAPSANGAWSVAMATSTETKIEVTLTTPDLPDAVPPSIATPQQIESERDWRATHRLMIRAPLVVFDLSWRRDEPLRILAFSRGDWERQLMALARAENAAP